MLPRGSQKPHIHRIRIRTLIPHHNLFLMSEPVLLGLVHLDPAQLGQALAQDHELDLPSEESLKRLFVHLVKVEELRQLSGLRS